MGFVLLLIMLGVLVLVGGVIAILMVLARHQKQTIAYDNEVVPGVPSNAPPSWAGSHDPEARLHRRLRDAVRALRNVNAYDTASSVNLRAGLEQSALAVDNHLVAISALPQSHRDQALVAVTDSVAAIEAGVAQYVSATTKPDPVAFENGLQGVQTSIDAITQKLAALGQGAPPAGIYPPQPGALPEPRPAYPQPPAGSGYPQPPTDSAFPQPGTGGSYPQPGTGQSYPQPGTGQSYPQPVYPQTGSAATPPGHADPTVRREF